MSRFKKLSYTLWYCNYHIVWTSKYWYRILEGEIKIEVENYLQQIVDRQGDVVEKLSVQKGHIHLLVCVTSKVSILSFVGTIKGRNTIRIFNKFK